MNLAELQRVQKEAEERRRAEEEAKKKQKQSNIDELFLHFKEEKDGSLWLIVRAQVQATQTKKGNISLHNTMWRKVKTAEGIEVVIPSFNPFIPMK